MTLRIIILNRTARAFYEGALTPIGLCKKVLDLACSQLELKSSQHGAKQLFKQKAKVLDKLKNIRHGREGRKESGVEFGQGFWACFKCCSLTHFVLDLPHQFYPN